MASRETTDEVATMEILVPFELDEKDRKAIALADKLKGLPDKDYCVFWVTMAVEAAQDEILEELDEHERKKKRR